MQVPQTESPSEFTTSAVLTAYKALPESLRPFYAHIHCGSAAIVAALGLTAEDNNVLETAVKAIGDLADDAEAFDRDAAAESGTLADMIRELAGTLGDDSNPLVVSLDVIWGAISSSSIVTGADPDDDEDPIEPYLYGSHGRLLGPSGGSRDHVRRTRHERRLPGQPHRTSDRGR